MARSVGTAPQARGNRAKNSSINSSGNDDHAVLLARGLSARMTGSNIPLTSLTQDEMERDLRHMEAFQNACTTYAQQFYIFQNQAKLQKQAQESKKPMPVISRTALPVRIDPEEEKRLDLLRQKIQTCEAQREVYEGQYLSLRAHYIFLSQELRDKREEVNTRVAFLQEQVRKRGRVVALQRVRLQVLRETLQCLQYRQQGGVPLDDVAVDNKDTVEKEDTEGEDAASGADPKPDNTPLDLYTVWNDIEAEWKKAEEDLKSKDGPAVMSWAASKIPKIPPGVPLLLSQLADQPGQAAAWNTGGAFGSNPDSLLWIHNQVPTTAPDTSDELPALRKQVSDLEAEIAREKAVSTQYQTDVIQRRHKNDELVAMMALLRTETEAVVARHNILLESDVAKRAAKRLHDEEAKSSAGAGGDDEVDESGGPGDSPAIDCEAEPKASVPSAERLKEDDENDGDDEGGAEEEEEEEDGEAAGSKRALGAENDTASSRSKRRKV